MASSATWPDVLLLAWACECREIVTGRCMLARVCGGVGALLYRLLAGLACPITGRVPASARASEDREVCLLVRVFVGVSCAIFLF